MDTESRTSAGIRTKTSLKTTTDWPPPSLRPLSDIREITEPSLMDMISHHPMHWPLHHKPTISKTSPVRYIESQMRDGSDDERNPKPYTDWHGRSRSVENGSSSYSSTPEPSGHYSIPPSSVPRRTSSCAQSHTRRAAKTHTRKSSVRMIRTDGPTAQPRASCRAIISDEPTVPTPPAKMPHVLSTRPSFTVPNRGHSESPVKEAGARLDPITCDVARKMPSKTFIRSPAPADILDFPNHRHPRVKLELHVTAPLFVGGGSVEGHVKITVDDNEGVGNRRSIGIASLSVDLLGYEEVADKRRSVFLALGTELLDSTHSPPMNMVELISPMTSGTRFWTLRPSISALPYMISLPLDTGPPPFHSKQASICFLLSVTATVKDAGKHYRVRSSQALAVLSTYDPEQALTALPSPLTASDEFVQKRGDASELLKLTAGLHRQVWVSGSSIFVDVHVSNKTRKPVKRLDLTLERNILYYRHAPAAITQLSEPQARVFESNNRLILAKSTLRRDGGKWRGVEAYSSDTRTCELEVPRAHATVTCGKYFEVRFFLNVTASLSNSKLVTVQLPIILIHMNSLDVLPNCVAQVATAIEQMRSHQRHPSSSPSHRPASRPSTGQQRSVSSPARTTMTRGLTRKPSYVQGRAFSAPRQQSLDRRKHERADIVELQRALDVSPRKRKPQPLQGIYLQQTVSNISSGAMSIGGGEVGQTHRTPPPGPSRIEIHPGDLHCHPREEKPVRDVRDRLPTEVARDGLLPAEQNYPQQQEEPVQGLRDRLKKMRSLDSLHSKQSISRLRRQKSVAPDPYHFPSRPAEPVLHVTREYQIAPHTLGLTVDNTAGHILALDGDQEGVASTIRLERPPTTTGFREKLDRSRFEFKAVGKKASGGMRVRGKAWIESIRFRGRSSEDGEESWI